MLEKEFPRGINQAEVVADVTEMYGNLNTKEIAYTSDGQRTLLPGLVVACALQPRRPTGCAD